MPIIDSTYGIVIADPKPAKVCQWLGCPDVDEGYGDRKMKMCARCNVVRYCSKECQRADWGDHKLYCQIPPIMDIGAWMDTHESLFRWALIEGLRLRSEPANINRYVLTVNMTRMDRLLKGINPSPFFVNSITRTKFDSMDILLPPRQSDASAIVAAGGIGTGAVVFNVSSGPGRGNYTMARFQYHKILEKPAGAESPPGMGWANIAKGVANGDIPISSLSRMAEAAHVDDQASS
ncbi:hypothetical protein C8F04DRAFT_1236886 [Mycena alexandri]|uniref:MYND-type domain-containing protein n=1 Tax=Mycena alexandri TaxID=1745969 RepID=A0AAD6SLL4_9AGAR|nr:hypothetical protein C8F04DRAFT_1236886 [Mycena alexandri]